jgi:hypothetical protein
MFMYTEEGIIAVGIGGAGITAILVRRAFGEGEKEVWVGFSGSSKCHAPRREFEL